MDLNGKKILLGVTGGIAAYKSCELLRLLQKKGAQVRVAMTEAATRFVAPLTFASLSKCPVYLKDGAVEARPFQHIDFPRWADLYLVVPCTANAIGKFAYGLADDPVSLCFMSCTCPRLLAPAMNVAMYNSPAVQRNLQTLRSFENTFVLESPAGELACGEVGSGRLLEPADIVKLIETDGVILSGARQGEVEGSKGGSLPLVGTSSPPTPSPRGSAPNTPRPLVMPHTDAASTFHTIKKAQHNHLLNKSESQGRCHPGLRAGAPAKKTVGRAFTSFAATLFLSCPSIKKIPTANKPAQIKVYSESRTYRGFL